MKPLFILPLLAGLCQAQTPAPENLAQEEKPTPPAPAVPAEPKTVRQGHY